MTGPISVNYGQLCDMVDDAQGSEREILRTGTVGEWNTLAAESAAMRRAITYAVSKTPEGRRAAWAYLKAWVTADNTPCGSVVIGLLAYMKGEGHE